VPEELFTPTHTGAVAWHTPHWLGVAVLSGHSCPAQSGHKLMAVGAPGITMEPLLISRTQSVLPDTVVMIMLAVSGRQMVVGMPFVNASTSSYTCCPVQSVMRMREAAVPTGPTISTVSMAMSLLHPYDGPLTPLKRSCVVPVGNWTVASPHGAAEQRVLLPGLLPCCCPVRFHTSVQTWPSGEVSRARVPMVAPYMKYLKLTAALVESNVGEVMYAAEPVDPGDVSKNM